MLEEENRDHDNDNDDDLPPSPKRTRTRNTLDEDETDIANDLRPSRLSLQSNNFDEENGSQEGDEYRGGDEASDQGDADRDFDNGMNFGNEDEPDFGGEEEFGDNGVCVSSFILFIELILYHFRSFTTMILSQPLLIQ